MTKKHFEAIAAIFGTRPFAGKVAEVNVIAYDLADYFASVNPNFDRSKFLDACGMN